MPKMTEDKLTFEFPNNWRAIKYDETTFYQKHFQKLANSKAVDFVACEIGGNDELWLIELKDYRIHPRTKAGDLFLEIASKVRDTLASLYLAQRKEEVDVYDFVKIASEKKRIRIVLHLEQPQKPSKLYPLVVERDNTQIKLRQQVQVVDRHAIVCELAKMPSQCKWTVTSK